MEKLLVNVEEAARVLSLGRSVIFEKIAAGELQSVKVGRRRLIPAKALEDFADRQIREAQAAG